MYAARGRTFAIVMQTSARSSNAFSSLDIQRRVTVKSYFCRFYIAAFVLSVHTKPVDVLSMEFATLLASAEYFLDSE